ncbi:MMPL family protein [Stratiformator vulcanicus]|uniref:MMPL family protein n=2 Tax=Stratiformator vulcanicus TaxID=2527980 RepID=A0A517R571_9PLAN|nr:MMPL family protein [Stratiformator vulcanicus]
MLLLLPVVGFGSRQAIHHTRIHPEEWLPASHPERAEYLNFTAEFEGHDVVLISWDGCTWDDPKLADLQSAFDKPDDPERAKYFEEIIDRAVSGSSLMDRLTAEPLNLEPDEAAERLKGSFIGPDGKTSCQLVVLTPEGNEDRTPSINAIIETAVEVTGLSREELVLTGPPYSGSVIDEESILSVRVFGGLSILAAFLLCRVCVGSWKLAGVIGGAALFSQFVALSIVHYSGIYMDAVLMALPTMVFVLTTSAGIHLSNYYFAAVAEGDPEPGVTALRRGWRPALLATLTTAIGLFSLAISEVQPVRAFGIIGGTGIIIGSLLVLALLPGFLTRAKINVRETKVGGWRDRFLGGMADWVIAAGPGIALMCLIAMVWSGMGLGSLKTAGDIPALFRPDSEIMRDYRWFEKNLGPTIPLDVVIQFEPDDEMSYAQQLQILGAVQESLNGIEGASGFVSAATFAPDLSGSGFSLLSRMRRLNQRLDEDTSEYIDEHLLVEQDGVKRWRISLRASTFNNRGYRAILEEIRDRTEAVLGEWDVVERPDRAEYAGMMAMIQKVEATILVDLFWSFLTAVILVSIVLMLAVQNVFRGAIAMLPNMFPIVLVFGTMGWFDIAIDIGAMMTASIALGIAIDDTIHLLFKFKSGLRDGGEVNTVLRRSIVSCGIPMVMTTVVCGIGFLPLVLSDFVPTNRFGILMCVLLVTALFGDLVFLPSLLGRWSRRKPKQDEPTDAESETNSAAEPAAS